VLFQLTCTYYKVTQLKGADTKVLYTVTFQKLTDVQLISEPLIVIHAQQLKY